MYTTTFCSPIGLLAALTYSDVKRQFDRFAIAARTIFSLMIYIALFSLIAFSSKPEISIFMTNNGWVLILSIVPLVTAAITEFLFRDRHNKRC